MEKVKTPAEVAAVFGCTEQQARNQIAHTVRQLKDGAIKARLSKSGKYRGFTSEYYETRAADFAAVLN